MIGEALGKWWEDSLQHVLGFGRMREYTNGGWRQEEGWHRGVFGSCCRIRRQYLCQFWRTSSSSKGVGMERVIRKESEHKKELWTVQSKGEFCRGRNKAGILEQGLHKEPEGLRGVFKLVLSYFSGFSYFKSLPRTLTTYLSFILSDLYIH